MSSIHEVPSQTRWRRFGKRLASLAAIVGVSGMSLAAAPNAAHADQITPWYGVGSTEVKCSPFSHSLTTDVTITPDFDMFLQVVGYVREIDRWDGAKWVDFYDDYATFYATSIPKTSTVLLPANSYYRVKVTYMWTKTGVRSTGSETINSYQQYGNTWQTKDEVHAVGYYCAV